MNTITTNPLAQLRLLQLVSPSLPVGAFTYSQGLEWAVECGWVKNADDLRAWVGDLMHTAMARLELPVLLRLHAAVSAGDNGQLETWTRYLIASRETRELREEEHNRGRALAALLPQLQIPVTPEQQPLAKGCQLTSFALAAHHWGIPLKEASAGYLWGWLENMVLAGVKIIPLGQTAGQQLIAELTEAIPGLVEQALDLEDEEIGTSCTAQAIASSRHESQYTRIYRS
jgi:urease accessory protein